MEDYLTATEAARECGDVDKRIMQLVLRRLAAEGSALVRRFGVGKSGPFVVRRADLPALRKIVEARKPGRPRKSGQ